MEFKGRFFTWSCGVEIKTFNLKKKLLKIMHSDNNLKNNGLKTTHILYI